MRPPKIPTIILSLISFVMYLDLLFPETDELEHNKRHQSVNKCQTFEIQWISLDACLSFYLSLSLALFLSNRERHIHTQTNNNEKKNERCNFPRSKEECWLLKLSVCLSTFTSGIKSRLCHKASLETCSFEISRNAHKFLLFFFFVSKEATERKREKNQ